MNPNSIRKLHAYSKNPELIKEPTMPELADLVIVVLGAVSQIEKAIKEGRLDGKTPEADKDYISAQTAKTMIRSELDNMLAQADSVLSQTATEMDKRVQQALQNIRNGNDGIVTDEEIERAAQMALSLIEVPDFDALVTKALTENANATRDGLESIKEEEDKLNIEAIGHLRKELDEIKKEGGKQAGGVSKNTVREMAWNNGSTTTPNTLTVSETEPLNPKTNDLWVDIS